MVPLSTLVNVREINGPIAMTRYNLYTAAAISRNMRPGFSSKKAIAISTQPKRARRLSYPKIPITVVAGITSRNSKALQPATVSIDSPWAAGVFVMTS